MKERPARGGRDVMGKGYAPNMNAHWTSKWLTQPASSKAWPGEDEGVLDM